MNPPGHTDNSIKEAVLVGGALFTVLAGILVVVYLGIYGLPEKVKRLAGSVTAGVRPVVQTPVPLTNAAPCDVRKHYEAGVWAGLNLGASAVQGLRPGVTNIPQLNAAAKGLVEAYKP